MIYLPEVFVDARYDAAFLKVFSDAFDELTAKAAASKQSWLRFIETLEKHRLTSVICERDLPVWDSLSIRIRQRFELPLSREEALDSERRAKAAAILAYLVAMRLLPLVATDEFLMTRHLLLKIDAELLERCLYRLNLSADAEMFASSVLQHHVRQAMAESALAFI